MKNTHDRQHDLAILDNPISSSRNIGEVRRKQRKLLREWAVNYRADFGRNSIFAYCERQHLIAQP